MRDLNKKIPGAKNFTYGEFVKSDVALRLGLKLEPTEEQWKAIEELAINVLQPIRDEFGRIRITSGFRSRELCIAIGAFKKVGSKKVVTSNHIRGEAADIEPIEEGVSLFEVLKWTHDNLDYRELIAEYFPMGWLHLAYRVGANNKLLKLKDVEHNYKVCSLEYIENIYSKI